MLGCLRFFLALAVAFSHMGLTPDFHFGAMAVVTFFMIAGYVMTHSFQANFGASLGNLRAFYTDRLVRLYPLYALSLVLILAFTLGAPYGKMYLDPKSILVNLTIVWGNVHPTLINPPAWSLATEMQFYLLLPFLVCFPRVKLLLLPLSYLVFLLASWEGIPAIEWGYKYLPGTLCMFILGSVIYDMRSDPTGRARRIVITGVALVLVQALLLANSKHIDHPYIFETLAGILLGVVGLLTLADSQPRYRALDDWLGKLSYPLFLSHPCVLYFFDHLRIQGAYTPSPRGAVAVQLIAAVALSVPLALLDDRVQRLRKRLQRRQTGTAPVKAVELKAA
ncbi:MAG: acyltransferase family protein [Gammaproteobacteria bacterium]